MNTNSKNPSYSSIAIIFLLFILWQLLLTFQGFDLSDTGLQLTSFQFAFDDPYSIQYSMSFWLSNVLGNLWMRILSTGGLHWARVGWVVMISCTVAVYFVLLKSKIGIRNTLLGLIITALFMLQGGFECLNYDIISMLMYAIAIVLLNFGLTQNRALLLFVSGVLFGISVFLKLSNVMYFIFIIIVPFSIYINHQPISKFVKASALWIAGFGLGCLSILLLIKLTGQMNLFSDNLTFMSVMVSDSKASHGMLPMLTSYLAGYANALVMLLLFIAASWCYSLVIRRFKIANTKLLNRFIYSALFVASICFMLLYGEVFWSKVRYLFLGLMIFWGTASLFDKQNSNELRILSLSGLLLLLIVPIGSDSGLEKSILGMWILGPMALTRFDNRYFNRLIKVDCGNNDFMRTSIAILVVVSAVCSAWSKTYNDLGTRLNKTYPIEHPKLHNIYTTKDRAEAMNSLIHEAFPLIKNEKYLLSFIEVPLLNYLSNKHPFISTSWPKLYYNPHSFKIKLDEAMQRRHTLPAIIRQKQNTMFCEWPTKPDAAYLSYPTALSKWPEHGAILNQFIAENNYKVAWENNMFQLLLVAK